MSEYFSTEITDQIEEFADLCANSKKISADSYATYDVKRGLRDLDGKGVLTGLTEISEVVGSENGKPCEGKLFYHGYNVEDLVRGCITDGRFGFEETTYLLLFGELPNEQALEKFTTLLSSYRTIPQSFVRDIIMKAPSKDMMNTLLRGVLTLYAYDDKADDISIPNVLRQCIQLIAQLPLLSVYSYYAYQYYYHKQSFIVHAPNAEYSTAENILHMLRKDSKFTPLEARVLDISLMLHAEHGGGNNSTFTTHVVTSTGTDTYSAVAASLASLKGPKHGGANLKVVKMFEDLKQNVKNLDSDEEVSEYLHLLLNKQAFDKSGLIYGMGHAVYSLSDPRAKAFKFFVGRLAEEKGISEEFELHSRVEHLAAEVIQRERKIYKGVSANVDFYSGFVYRMLGLPMELYTPIFAIARISGWSAHRLEELVNSGKIIRPAYKSISKRRPYPEMKNR